MKPFWGILLAVLSGCTYDPPGTLTIYCASSLVEFCQALSPEGGPPAHIRGESSGSLAQELRQGAQADLFFSAHTGWIAFLQEEGLILENSRMVLGTNQLVVAVSKDHPLVSNWEDLGSLNTIALGEPSSVPGGTYAKEAMEGLGVWNSLSSHLIFAPSVRAALTLVEHNRVDAAIVYSSDMKLAVNSRIGWVIDESLHTPILIEGCVLKSSKFPKQARSILSGIKSESGSSLLKKHGLNPSHDS
jgi:molybdate transport system substrate-binding protein